MSEICKKWCTSRARLLMVGRLWADRPVGSSASGGFSADYNRVYYS